jgi:hypothetical protein
MRPICCRDICVRAMTNHFGAVLHDESVRWAAAQGVPETVIAAVRLLHERNVDEIVPLALPSLSR